MGTVHQVAVHSGGSITVFQPQKDLLLPPATKLGQGYIFAGVCDSVNGGGVLPGGVLPPGGEGASSGRDTSSLGGSVPGGAWWRHPRDGHCCGRYASYWNAFLFSKIFAENWIKWKRERHASLVSPTSATEFWMVQAVSYRKEHLKIRNWLLYIWI